MGEHHGHDAVRLDNAAAFAEYLAHLGVIVVGGEIAGGLGGSALARGLRPKPRRAGYRLIRLVRQIRARELFPKRVAGGALEPHEEEVGQLGVVHIVVIGRVKHDRVNRGVVHIQRLRRAVENH